MTAQVIHADCLDALAAMAENSVDSVVCDPPYGLAFMGKHWDHAVPGVEYWRECLRVLKPGGHLISFGGTRTYHRMACAIEDAGFEIRDQLLWLYGSGFPKSHDVSKGIDKAAGATREIIRERYTAKRIKPGATVVREGAYGKQDISFTATDTAPATETAAEWQGWGTALKPAVEPLVLARKPLSESTVVANVLRWGTGALNIDGCRVASEESTIRPFGRQDETRAAGYGFSGGATGGSDRGRWPANVIHDGSEEVLGAFPDAPGQIMDARTDRDIKTRNVYGAMRDGELSAESDNLGVVGFKMKPGARRADAGSAARFFYCAKASPSDRDDGLDDFEVKQHVQFATANGTSGKASSISEGRDTRRANTHPTVKPTELMRYLCRLVTPPGGTVLDPFAGSGSTGRGAILEGFSFIGIEREEKYVAIARARIQSAQDRVHARTEEAEKAIFKASEQPSLFGAMAPPYPHTPPLDTQAGAE